jgi:hypothetical protein
MKNGRQAFQLNNSFAIVSKIINDEIIERSSAIMRDRYLNSKIKPYSVKVSTTVLQYPIIVSILFNYISDI